MKLERYKEKSECHECGKIAKTYSIELNHLCQHYLNLCSKCLKKLRGIICDIH